MANATSAIYTVASIRDRGYYWQCRAKCQESGHEFSAYTAALRPRKKWATNRTRDGTERSGVSGLHFLTRSAARCPQLTR